MCGKVTVRAHAERPAGDHILRVIRFAPTHVLFRSEGGALRHRGSPISKIAARSAGGALASSALSCVNIGCFPTDVPARRVAQHHANSILMV
jgi:hypothetical protein